MSVKSLVRSGIKSVSWASLALFITANNALAVGDNNLFERFNELGEDWSEQGAKAGLTAATLVSVALIIFAMFGNFHPKVFMRVGVCILGLSCVGWIVQQIYGS